LKGDLALEGVTTVYAGDGCYCVDPYLNNGKSYIVYAIVDGAGSDYRSLNGCATRSIGE